MSSDGKIDLDEIDDVEGHGFKAVVSGVGAAAVLAGGVSAAVGLTALPKVHPSGSTSTLSAGVRKVATVLSVVATADHGVHTATALLKQVVPHPHEITGWILVKAADTVLAQVHVKDGRATATWTMPAHTALSSVVLSYTGDDRYAPALRTLDL